MNDAKTHYDQVLGGIYSWMAGDFEDSVKSASDLLAGVGVGPNSRMLDLGAGHGIHAVAAARRGATVVAVEQCEILADELRVNAGSHSIDVQIDEMQRWVARDPGVYDVVVCLTDTLLHLPSNESAEEFLVRCATRLSPGGHLVISVRDYTSADAGDQVCLIARAEDFRVHTCMLQYEETSVRVHDIIHEKGENGWQVIHSDYQKLRFSPQQIASVADKYGLALTDTWELRGMHYLIFNKLV